MKKRTLILLNAFIVYLISFIGFLYDYDPLIIIFGLLTLIYLVLSIMFLFMYLSADEEDSKKLNTKIFENPEKVELIERRHKLVLDFLDYGVTTQEKALEKIDIIDKQLKLIDGKD